MENRAVVKSPRQRLDTITESRIRRDILVIVEVAKGEQYYSFDKILINREHIEVIIVAS